MILSWSSLDQTKVSVLFLKAAFVSQSRGKNPHPCSLPAGAKKLSSITPKSLAKSSHTNSEDSKIPNWRHISLMWPLVNNSSLWEGWQPSRQTMSLFFLWQGPILSFITNYSPVWDRVLQRSFKIRFKIYVYSTWVPQSVSAEVKRWNEHDLLDVWVGEKNLTVCKWCWGPLH